MTDIKTRLAQHAIDVILAENEFSRAYSDLKDSSDSSNACYQYGKAYMDRQKLKEAGKELYKQVTENIRNSNGKLTLNKLIEGENE